MGEVILGMPGPWAKDYREVADHYTTKAGGLPDWPILEVDIRPDFLQCGACGARLSLVVQLYAPLLSDTWKIEERIIYVFGCTMQKCGSNPLSWRALRVQKTNTAEASSTNEKATSLGAPSAPVSNNMWLEDIWADDSGEIGDSLDTDVDLEELGRAFSEAASLGSHSKKQSYNQQHATVKTAAAARSTAEFTDTNIPVLPCFYIYSQKESPLRHANAVCSNYVLSAKDKKSDPDDPKEDETWEEEGYEYDKALFVDRTFMKFKKRMDAYPEQCFRYSYGGKPLLASKELEVSASCRLCGAFRQYEMQLMPPLSYFLRETRGDSSIHSAENWNWMTLIVYTCSKNCSPVMGQEGSSCKDWSVAEETVIGQFE